MEKYEKLNWRIISKPGGATVKPDDFYVLYGSVHRKIFLPWRLEASLAPSA